MLLAYEDGASVEVIARRLSLPESWVEERIEAARLAVLATAGEYAD